MRLSVYTALGQLHVCYVYSMYVAIFNDFLHVPVTTGALPSQSDATQERCIAMEGKLKLNIITLVCLLCVY